VRVLIILDNPQRDVYGVFSLSREFQNIGFEVFVSGLLTAPIDFFLVKPDIVIHTYLRKNNLEFLSMIKNCGCLNIVIESEGIVGKSIDDYLKFVSNCASFDIIDAYFTWGKKQQFCLIENYPSFADKIYCFGNPRFDEFRVFVRDTIPEKTILINTNFPIVDPKFTNLRKSEVQRNVDVGHDLKIMEEVYNSSLIVKVRLCKLVSDLSILFPDFLFIVRPHPFESSHYYDSYFEEHLNVQINTEGTSIEALKKVAILIQLNCTTSMEAYLLGIPVLMPDYLNFDNLRYLASEKFSKKIYSFTDLKTEISEILGSANIKQQLLTANDYLFIGEESSSHYIVNCISGLIEKSNLCFIKYFSYYLVRFIRSRLSFKFRKNVQLKQYNSLSDIKGFERISSSFSSGFLFGFK
jgi:surface carbohydrate biosynthesis protein